MELFHLTPSDFSACVRTGQDWFYLDWIRLEKVLPAYYSPSWSLPIPALGLRGQRETILYVIHPGTEYPLNATNAAVSALEHASLTLTNWPAGRYRINWFHPANTLSLVESDRGYWRIRKNFPESS